MKLMPLLMAAFLFAGCSKDDAKQKSTLSATINGTQYTTTDLTIEKDGATGELLQFSGRFSDGAVIGIRTKYDLSFPPGSYNFRLADIHPATLISFGVQPFEHHFRLTWATAQETSLQVFVVERSGNAQEFKAVGSVAATGSTTTVTNYSYVDTTSSATAKYYYRLRMNDAGGSGAYSQVLTVNRLSTGYSAFYGSGSDIFYGYNGNLQVTANDRNNGILEGTFSFDATTAQGRKQVRNGSFKVRY